MKIDYIFDKGLSKEDTYLIKDNISGVFDGYDSLNKFVDKGGKTGGLIAATIAKDNFSKNDKSLLDLALEANKKIKEKMSILKIKRDNNKNLWGTSAAVIRIKENSFEWIQVQDSLILVIYKDNNFKLLVEDYDHDKELLIIWKKLAEQKKENIRELIKGSLAQLREKMNKCGYSTLNGQKDVVSFIKGGEENLENIMHILLFTDGLFIPKEDPLENDDWNMFVKLFLEGGLRKIRDFVRNLEKDDPKCWKYPRFKQHDDITAISISF